LLGLVVGVVTVRRRRLPDQVDRPGLLLRRRGALVMVARTPAVTPGAASPALRRRRGGRLPRLGGGCRVAHGLGHLLRDGQPRGTAAPLAEPPPGGAAAALGGPPAEDVPVGRGAGPPVRGPGRQPPLVGVGPDDAVARLRQVVGPARPAPAPG